MKVYQRTQAQFAHSIRTAKNGFLRLFGAARAIVDPEKRKLCSLRRDAELALNALAQNSGSTPIVEESALVLVDGMWDNPNYWLRYSLFRSAAGLDRCREVVLIGRWRRAQVMATARNLEIRQSVDLQNMMKNVGPCVGEAREILAGLSDPGDLMNIRLPGECPGSLVYDQLLRDQRRGTVDLSDPDLDRKLGECLRSIRAAELIFQENDYKLVVLSQMIGPEFGAIAWFALRSGAKVFVLAGQHGIQRFTLLKTTSDFQNGVNRPTRLELDCIASPQKERLIHAGASYLERRLSGHARDMGAKYAYTMRTDQVTREAIVEKFNWDPAKPIVAIYASNWCDYPHTVKMQRFRDFLDWATQTVQTLAQANEVNWLLKPHPCDSWFEKLNGPKLVDLVDEVNVPHVRMVDEHWNGRDLFESIDGLVTYLGTAGIEFSGLGKPVMVAEEGWYGDCGFCYLPDSKDAYLEALRNGNWLKTTEGCSVSRRACLFIGWYFCTPSWQKSFILPNDSDQDKIYRTQETFISENFSSIENEINHIRLWINSSHRFYHTFKISINKYFKIGDAQ